MPRKPVPKAPAADIRYPEVPRTVDPDPYRRELKLPEVPRAQGGMAMDDSGYGGSFPYSNYLNTIGGLQFGLYFPGYQYLAELAQRTEYRQPVETYAKELTRRWISFKSVGEGDKSDRIKKIQDAFKEFNCQEIARKAVTHDGFFGIGHVYIAIDGQQDPESKKLPLPYEPETIKKGSLLGFKNIEPMWCTPLAWNSIDPTSTDFYRPTLWVVLGQTIHANRLLQFVSREVPDIIKPAYNFGGISLTQLIQPYVDRWLKTVMNVNQLISNFSVMTLQTDMLSALEKGKNEGIIRRAEFFTKTRNNQGLFLLDKERELLENVEVSLAGLSELQAQSQEQMAAPTHLPLVVLTGITPSGLNASSEGEIQIHYDNMNATQEVVLRDNLEKMLKCVQLHLFGDIDPEIVIVFEPMMQLQGRAAAEVYETKATAGQGYVAAGVISPEEERERLANDPDSGYVNLDVNDVPEAPDMQMTKYETENAPKPAPGGKSKG